MRTIALLVALCPSTLSLRLQPLAPKLACVRPVHSFRRARNTLLSEEPAGAPENEKVSEIEKANENEKAKRAAEKRLAAEKLALQAERAALEAEKLSLQAKQKKLAKQVLEESSFQESAPLPTAMPKLSTEIGEQSVKEEVNLNVSSFSFPANGGSFSLNSTFDIDAAIDQLEAQANATELQRNMGGGIANVLQRSGLSPEEIQLTEAQTQAVKENVFNLETFYVKAVAQTPVGTIFDGNLRSKPAKVAERVRERLQGAGSELEGVQLLLVEDPRPLTDAQLRAGEDKRPVYLALSPAAAALSQPWQEKVAALAALFFSCISTLGYAFSAYILADEGKLLTRLSDGDPTALDLALPIAFGLGAIQIAHETAHLIAAGRSGLKTGVPLLLPSLQLGTFGCITPLLSFPKSRQELFDFALSGPAVASGISLVVYLVGLVLSTGDFGAAADPGSIPVLPTGLLKSSLLLGSLAQAFLPSVATQLTVQIHPLAVVGFTGALLNALQLLPIGRLDGGRVSLAVFGQNGAGLVSGLFLLGLGVSSIFFGDNPILLFFGLFIIFLQRAPEVPSEDDLTEVDSSRQLAALAALTFCLVTLLPFPANVPPPDNLF